MHQHEIPSLQANRKMVISIVFMKWDFSKFQKEVEGMVRKCILDKDQCLGEDSVERAFLILFQEVQAHKNIEMDISTKMISFYSKAVLLSRDEYVVICGKRPREATEQPQVHRARTNSVF